MWLQICREIKLHWFWKWGCTVPQDPTRISYGYAHGVEAVSISQYQVKKVAGAN